MKVLIVDDDPRAVAVARARLEKDDLTVVSADSGRAGLKAAKRDKPDLILLDVDMPDLSGFDVCRELRRLGQRQPIIMLTVRGEETDKVLGLEVGADDYVTKPYNLRELLARIRAQLRRAYGDLAAAEADLLYAGDLVIDRGRAQVQRGSQLLNLTPTELRLLVYLAQNPGQALSRTQILDAVWGYGADVESERIVNVHIRRLREKVELDPSRPTLILTVPGIGYRLAG